MSQQDDKPRQKPYSIRSCRGHWHVIVADTDVGEAWNTAEEAQAEADRLNAQSEEDESAAADEGRKKACGGCCCCANRCNGCCCCASGCKGCCCCLDGRCGRKAARHTKGCCREGDGAAKCCPCEGRGSIGEMAEQEIRQAADQIRQAGRDVEKRLKETAAALANQLADDIERGARQIVSALRKAAG